MMAKRHAAETAGFCHLLLGIGDDRGPSVRIIHPEVHSRIHVTAQTPPTFIYHTTTDDVVPVDASVTFYRTLQGAGVPAEMHVFASGAHGSRLGIVAGSVGDEAKQALSNVRAIVGTVGGTMANLVQCTIYISDIAHWAEVDGVYGAFFSGVPVLPARAVVPVREMHYGAHIEIQPIAVMDLP